MNKKELIEFYKKERDKIENEIAKSRNITTANMRHIELKRIEEFINALEELED